jgi:nicotinamide-nucleotide amidase
MSASIITVGTEITDGQIINSNSQWIAKKLDNLEIRTVLHLSVPDNKDLMIAAFEFASLTTELVFICGGLGPTVDDFTRDVVSEFLNQPLVTDPVALEKIESKLSERRLAIQNGHRRQALIPKTARALNNSYGVAPGFVIESSSLHGNNQYWVLPGPPLEIEAIWNDHIQESMENRPKIEQALRLHTWLCLGIPESEIARITEEFFDTFEFEKEYGYRINMPYVEVKLWCDSRIEEVQNALADFPNKIGSSYVGKTLEEVHQPFLNLLARYSHLQITDNFSDGLLLQKLQQLVPKEVLTKLNLNYTLGSTKIIPRSAVLKGSLLIEIQTPKNQEVIWHLKSSEMEQQIRVPLVPRRSARFNTLYALEALFLKAPSNTSITSE